jgi:hypothetical protein
MKIRCLVAALALLSVQAGQERRPEVWDQVSESNLKATVEKLVSFGTRNSLSTKGIGEAAAWLKGEFEKVAKTAKGEMKVEFHEFTDPRLKRNGELVPQKNVTAILRGKSRPKEVVVFGGHYDSLNLRDKDPDAIAPGANDNATGSAGVLEAARLLSQVEHERSIAFACFAGEEQGLIGAWHFAKFLKDSGWTVVAMLNNDIIGGAKDDEGKPLNDKDVRCFSAPPQDSDSRRLARLAKVAVERRIKDFTVLLQDRLDRPKRGGDHKSFNDHGMAAIRFIETNETDKLHHTADDVIARLHFPYCARVVRADIALLMNLASAPAAPATPELKVEGKTVSVSWKPVDGAKEYVVGVRRGGLEFERLVPADGAGMKLTVEGDEPLSVCVAAIANGHVSLFSPEAAR